MRIMGVDHTSYTVSNLERLSGVYIGILGCDILWQRNIANDYFREIYRISGLCRKGCSPVHSRCGTSHRII